MKNLLIVILLPLAGISQTKQEVYDYLREIDCKYPKIVTAQSVLETGHYKSYSCRTRHNLFGLRYDHKYLIFDTWQQSCDAYMSKIQYKYVEGDYYTFLQNLGYATDPEYINKLKSIKI
jgi:flagellum-specific peptidoglycan hydrolase FlgJ